MIYRELFLIFFSRQSADLFTSLSACKCFRLFWLIPMWTFGFRLVFSL